MASGFVGHIACGISLQTSCDGLLDSWPSSRSAEPTFRQPSDLALLMSLPSGASCTAGWRCEAGAHTDRKEQRDRPAQNSFCLHLVPLFTVSSVLQTAITLGLIVTLLILRRTRCCLPYSRARRSYRCREGPPSTRSCFSGWDATT